MLLSSISVLQDNLITADLDYEPNPNSKKITFNCTFILCLLFMLQPDQPRLLEAENLLTKSVSKPFLFPACKMVILTCEGWLRETTKMNCTTQSQASWSIFKDHCSSSELPESTTSESRRVKKHYTLWPLHSLNSYESNVNMMATTQ